MLNFLRRLFGGGRPPPDQWKTRFAAVRDQRDEATRALERWKAGVEDARRERDEALQAAERWKAHYTENRAQLDRLRRAQADDTYLLDVLLTRAAAVRRRAAEPASRERHEHLLTVSADYAREHADAAAGNADGLSPIEIHGLPWWVPTDPRLPERPERAARQGLPLRALLSARELAIGHTMIDIGANIGRTSIPRVILGDVQRSYCAEPDPGNYRALVRTVHDQGLTGLVLPANVAIGAETGEALLRQSRYPGGHALVGAGSTAPDGPTIAVRVVTLDDYVAEMGIELSDVAFIKVDVQGYEPGVLRGAARVLAQPQIVWQLEIDLGRLARAGSSLADLDALCGPHFDYFCDLNRDAWSPRRLPIREFLEGLTYLERAEHPKTDILLYRTGRTDAV